MTDDKVTTLRVVPSIKQGQTDEGILSAIKTFLNDENIITEEITDDDVALENPTSDETYLGELNSTEKGFFIIGQLLNEIIKEEMVEIEAANSDKITAIMRERKISMTDAAQVFTENREHYITDEQRKFLNQCGVTMGNVLTIYEWSLRVRFNHWTNPIIIREGFKAFYYE